MSTTAVFVLIIAGVVAFMAAIVLLTILARKAQVKKMTAYAKNLSMPFSQDGKESQDTVYVLESRMAYFAAPKPGYYTNNLPQIRMRVAVYPDDGPMQVVTSMKPFMPGMSEKLAPGTLVNALFFRNERGAVRDLQVMNERNAEWSGDVSVRKASENIENQLSQGTAADSQGTILSMQDSGASFCGIPVYQYRVSFQTRDGLIEGDTFQQTRTWLQQKRKADPNVKVKYCTADPKVFEIEME